MEHGFGHGRAGVIDDLAIGISPLHQGRGMGHAKFERFPLRDKLDTAVGACQPGEHADIHKRLMQTRRRKENVGRHRARVGPRCEVQADWKQRIVVLATEMVYHRDFLCERHQSTGLLQVLWIEPRP